MTTTIANPSTGLDTETVLDEGLMEQVRSITSDNSDNETLTHIVYMPPKALAEGTTVYDYVLNARIFGIEIEALCGYKWIPHKDPKKFPVCSKCKAAFESIGHDGVPSE